LKELLDNKERFVEMFFDEQNSKMGKEKITEFY